MRMSPIERRIDKDDAYFFSLPLEQQRRLRAGRVEPEDTTRMVSIALGKPDKRIQKKRLDGRVEIWEYYKKEYHEGTHTIEYETQEEKHGRLQKVKKSKDVTVKIPQEKVYRRIVFNDGVVVEIEEIDW